MTPSAFMMTLQQPEMRMNWLFSEAATYFEDTRNIGAESSEGVEEHAVGDASFPCSFSCVWGCQFAMLVCIPRLKNISKHACLYFGVAYVKGGVQYVSMEMDCHELILSCFGHRFTTNLLL